MFAMSRTLLTLVAIGCVQRTTADPWTALAQVATSGIEAMTKPNLDVTDIKSTVESVFQGHSAKTENEIKAISNKLTEILEQLKKNHAQIVTTAGQLISQTYMALTASALYVLLLEVVEIGKQAAKLEVELYELRIEVVTFRSNPKVKNCLDGLGSYSMVLGPEYEWLLNHLDGFDKHVKSLMDNLVDSMSRCKIIGIVAPILTLALAYFVAMQMRDRVHEYCKCECRRTGVAAVASFVLVVAVGVQICRYNWDHYNRCQHLYENAQQVHHAIQIPKQTIKVAMQVQHFP